MKRIIIFVDYENVQQVRLNNSELEYLFYVFILDFGLNNSVLRIEMTQNEAKSYQITAF